MSDKKIAVTVSGGDLVENELVAISIHHHLTHGGWGNVTVEDPAGQPTKEALEGITLYDMVDRLRPELFDTSIVVKGSLPQSFPDQPIVTDSHGTERYKTNEVVRYLLDEGPFDMNHLARIPFPLEDRQQFAQMIGYSTGGYDTLSYSPASLAAEASERARDEVERVKNHGAASMSHTEVEARDYDPVDNKTFAVEVEQPSTDNTSN